jgi:hypothetical protein
VSQPNGSCGTAPSGGTNATVHIFPNFTSFLDSARDLAVVVMDSPWLQRSGDPAIDVMRISVSPVGAGVSYVVNGYGAHADNGSGLGVHRNALAVQGIDDSFAGYWRDKVQSGVGRPCKGDSGSPAINRSLISGSLHLVVGIMNNLQPGVEGTFCPEPGAFFRYSKVDDKIGFIESVIGPCSAQSSNGTHFRKCF